MAGIATMGTLQSCKDELADFKDHQYVYDQYKIGDLINGLRADLGTAQDACDRKIADLQRQITSNDGDIANLKDSIVKLEGLIYDRVTYDVLNREINKLDSASKAYTDREINKLDSASKAYTDTAFKKLNTELQSVKTLYDRLFKETNTRIDSVGNVVNGVKADLDQLAEKVSNLNTDVEKLKTDYVLMNLRLEVMETAVSEIKTELGKINQTLANHEEIMGGLQDQITTLGTQIDAVRDDLDLVKGDVSKNAADIAALDKRLTALENGFDVMTNRFNSLLTSIIIQGAESPVFGTFNLPIGVRSNMVFDWYGNFAQDVTFPSNEAKYTYDALNSALTSEDIAFLRGIGMTPETIKAGFVANETLGTVYMTLNPIGHNLIPGKTFKLETSAGRDSKLEVKPTVCDKEITFGYTRANNGFYSADLKLSDDQAKRVDQVNNIRINIDQELKSAAKDVLKDRTKRNALNLLKAIYHQIDGFVPAYALRADWSVDSLGTVKNYAVISGYDLAVATAKPLSYKFLYGEGTSHRLPTYGHIDNIINDLKEDLKFTLDTEFDIDTDFKVEFEGFDLKINTTVSVERKELVITIPSIKVYGDDPMTPDVVEKDHLIGESQETTTIVTANQLKGLYDAIEKGFNDAIKNLSADLNTQINQQIKDKLITNIETQVSDMLKDIKNQVNDMLSNLEGQINDQMAEIIDKFADKGQPFFDRVNQAIDLYNKVANKINNFLANPNHYLQPVALYKNNGGVGIVSNVKNDPTIFKYAGGDALSLYLTSYTAETVAPAYKKFAAVVNVYDANGNSVREAEKENLRKTNAGSNLLNRVVTGRTIRCGIPAANLKAGYTYEIVYQAVDYSGVTSTQKFYIKVEK